MAISEQERRRYLIQKLTEEGLSGSDIAHIMKLPLRTVQMYRSKILPKHVMVAEQYQNKANYRRAQRRKMYYTNEEYRQKRIKEAADWKQRQKLKPAVKHRALAS